MAGGVRPPGPATAAGERGGAERGQPGAQGCAVGGRRAAGGAGRCAGGVYSLTITWRVTV